MTPRPGYRYRRHIVRLQNRLGCKKSHRTGAIADGVCFTKKACYSGTTTYGPRFYRSQRRCVKVRHKEPLRSMVSRVIEHKVNARAYQGGLQSAIHFIRTRFTKRQPYAQPPLPRTLYRASGRHMYFQRHGAPAHTARTTQTWLRNNHVIYLNDGTWPAMSLYINPVEHVWLLTLGGRSFYREGCATGRSPHRLCQGPTFRHPRVVL